MPVERKGLDMIQKYMAKYSPATIGTRYEQVTSIASDRLIEGASKVDAVRKIITPILDRYGIGGGQRGAYISFALKLWRHITVQSGENIPKIASGLEDLFETSYGLDRAVLDEIVYALTVLLPLNLWEVAEWEIGEWSE